MLSDHSDTDGDTRNDDRVDDYAGSPELRDSKGGGVRGSLVLIWIFFGSVFGLEIKAAYQERRFLECTWSVKG
ncbi:hypothetical protein ACTXT7_003249 [Hymenolepis weldensis]